MNSFGKAFVHVQNCLLLFVDEENVECAKLESWKNKNIDGFLRDPIS